MRKIIITNNPLATAGDGETLVFIEDKALEVLKRSRDYIHSGWKLITHPLTGNIKPSWIFFKTLYLEEGEEEGAPDTLSLVLISDTIGLLERVGLEDLNPKIITDLMFIDWELAQNNQGRF